MSEQGTSAEKENLADQDAADLARFGYKQELKRELSVFSSFAIAFSYISPSTGIFTLYFLALTIGGVMFWTWPIVAIGQLFIALNFAELASHYPIAGSVYQWTKYLAPRGYAWFTGWFYLFAGILTVAAVCATLPLALIPFFNGIGWDLTNNVSNGRWIAIVTLIVVTLLNIYGVRLVSIVNNTGVLFEILGMVVFALILAIAHNHQGVGVVTDSAGQPLTPGTFLIAMFMSLFVIYGFDTAGTLAEETKNPKREAPRAIIGAVIGAFIIGAVFLLGTLMAIPNLKEAATSLATSPATVIDTAFGQGSFFSNVYLFVVSAAIFVCCMAIMTSTIRLCFGMARDQQLPGGRTLARVSPRLHTPIWSCIAIGLLAAIPFVQFAGASTIALSATAMIYLSYLLGNLAFMRARMRGWPRTSAPFKLGAWGKVVTALGILWGFGMLVNFLWTSPGDSAFSSDATLRVFSNPSADQTDYFTKGDHLVNFGISFLNKIPLIELVMAVVLVLGILYYFGWQRRKPPAMAVPRDDLVPAAPVGDAAT
jgi:amino acid transporter